MLFYGEKIVKIGQVYTEIFDKYAEPREHATQFPFVSLFSAETTGPIFTKILHVIVALVVLFNHAYIYRAVSYTHLTLPTIYSV